MRFAIYVVFVVTAVILAPAAVAADNFCMDCAARLIGGENGYRDAMCCMARAGDSECWGGYIVDEPNVGAGCIVRVDTEGNEWCNSYTYDSGCPGGGGGGDDCTTSTGYCSPQCQSCKPNV